MMRLSARGSLILAIFVIAASTSEAWWGTRSSSNSGGGGGSSRWFRRTWNKVRKRAEYAEDYAGGTYDTGKAYTDARGYIDQNWKGDNAAGSAADLEANRWERNGRDPNKYRPAGLSEINRKK